LSRIERLAERLEQPLLVTSPTNVRYLSGLRSSNAVLLVEEGKATLFSDFRYAEAARALGRVPFVELPRNLLGALAERLSARRIGFEAEHLSYAGYETLTAGGVELVPTRGLVEALRRVKEPGEIDAIRRAAALSDRVYEALAAERFSGRTERALAWWVERAFHELGAEGVAFPTIVAAGENGALPHALPGERRIEAGTLVTVDAGCVVDGYCSDCTRTFAVGVPAPALDELYELCLRAQRDGLAAVRAGVRSRDADAASRAAIEEAGLGERYGHGLGHGVGLDVHEAPALRPESEDVLEPGNVVTVEPGLYLPGTGGVRIEDLVLVTEEGCERLTRHPTDRIEVG
jgi:Xaa-Pro aminopeptidase